MLLWSMKLAVHIVNHVLSHGYSSIHLCPKLLLLSKFIHSQLCSTKSGQLVFQPISIGWYLLNKGLCIDFNLTYEADWPVSLYWHCLLSVVKSCLVSWLLVYSPLAKLLMPKFCYVQYSAPHKSASCFLNQILVMLVEFCFMYQHPYLKHVYLFHYMLSVLKAIIFCWTFVFSAIVIIISLLQIAHI